MREVREFTPEDARGLAQCLNESEGGWPGGLTRGVRATAEQVLEDYEKEDRIAWLIALSDGKVVGVSTLHPHYRDPEAAYLGFLNVADAYRGKGFGKALLLESVRLVAEKGYQRLDLHTWAGNMNAVPVYKRTGFFWRPDTNVLMENFVPLVLGMPIARPFFQRHPDWYGCYRREVKLEPDEMEHRGLRVYEMTWCADGDLLRVLIDRESREPTLVETENLLAECWVASPEPPLGVPLPVEWTVENKTNQPLKCQVEVRLPRGFHLLKKPPRSIVVAPREREVVRSSLVGDVDVIPPPEEETAPSLETHLRVNGVPLVLKTGLRVKHPLEVGTVPWTLWCRPGSQLTLPLTFKSNIRAPARGVVTLKARGGLHLSQTRIELEVEPEGMVGAEVEASVDPDIGTMALPIKVWTDLEVEGRRLRTRTETLYLHCLDLGGVLVTPRDEGRRLVVHTEMFHFEINLAKGAHLDRLYSKVSGRQHLRSHLRDALGPPFWPSEQMRTHFSHRVERPGDGTVRIVTWMDSRKYPGVRFTKTLVVTGGSPLIRIDYSLRNSHPSRTYRLRIRLVGWMESSDHLHTLPLRDGLLRDEAVEGEFFASDQEVPRKREDWEETWYCAEHPSTGEVTAILINPQSFHRVDAHEEGPLRFELEAPPLSPRSTVSLPPLYLLAGPGTWQHVRNLWRQLCLNQFKPKRVHPIPHRLLEAETDPAPLLVKADSQVKVSLVVRQRVKRPVDGTLHLQPPPGWKVKPESITISQVERGKPHHLTAILQSSKDEKPTVGILTLQARLETKLRPYLFDLPVILSYGPGRVTITKDREEDFDIFLVDNGSYLAKVAPSFAGSVYSLMDRKTGRNYLKSTFPKAGPMVWMNPWHGGIRFSPFLYGQPVWERTRLHRETWRARPTERAGWRGVKLTLRPRKKERRLRGFQLEFSVLTKPSSNIFALISRVTNLTGARRLLNHRLEVSIEPDGLETVVPRSTGILRRRRTTTHGYVQSTEQYVAVEDPERNETLLFVFPHGREGRLHLSDMAPHLILIEGGETLELPPHSSKEHTAFLVIAKTPWAQAKHYAKLAGLTL